MSGIGLKQDRDPEGSAYQHEEIFVETMSIAQLPMRRYSGHPAALPHLLLCRFVTPISSKCPGRRRQNDDTADTCTKVALSMNAKEDELWRHFHGISQRGWS